MKKLLLLIAVVTLQTTAQAQVPKKVLVEHFTNTLCGPCGQRNPGFYNNLENQTGIVHLSIYSSAPYSSCALYQQNVAPSDSRRFHYTINSTPSLIMNGFTIPSQNNYSSPALFAPFLGQMSPVSIRMEQHKFGTDSMHVRVIVKTEASHNLGMQQLLVGVAEDTVFYSAPNNEAEHYDVYRDQLQWSNLTLPTNVGDSLVFNYRVYDDLNWDFNRIFAFAMLQNVSNKFVNQVEATNPTSNNLVTAIPIVKAEMEGVRVFPNPTTAQLNVALETTDQVYLSLYNAMGQLLLEQSISGSAQLNLRTYAKGLYFVRIENELGWTTKKIVIE